VRFIDGIEFDRVVIQEVVVRELAPAPGPMMKEIQDTIQKDLANQRLIPLAGSPKTAPGPSQSPMQNQAGNAMFPMPLPVSSMADMANVRGGSGLASLLNQETSLQPATLQTSDVGLDDAATASGVLPVPHAFAFRFRFSLAAACHSACFPCLMLLASCFWPHAFCLMLVALCFCLTPLHRAFGLMLLPHAFASCFWPYAFASCFWPPVFSSCVWPRAFASCFCWKFATQDAFAPCISIWILIVLARGLPFRMLERPLVCVCPSGPLGLPGCRYMTAPLSSVLP
jgi:hypothetical protein